MGDVEYGMLETADQIPGGGVRGSSPLNALVEGILKDDGHWGKATRIAAYAKKTAAGAAANVLRQRYGRNITVSGLEFAARRVQVRKEDGSLDEATGLWVYCDPSKIVPGALEEHQRNEADRKTKLAAKVKAKAKTKVEKVEKVA